MTWNLDISPEILLIKSLSDIFLDDNSNVGCFYSQFLLLPALHALCVHVPIVAFTCNCSEIFGFLNEKVEVFGFKSIEAQMYQ